MIPARDALQRLKDGNARFASNVRSIDSLVTHLRRGDLVAAQTPFAIVLGCADSRVPAEIVFDQGVGDLFVVRVAGNIVAPSLTGSVELAVERFGTRLVVVLGHSDCGAIGAAVDAMQDAGPDVSPNLAVILESLRPAIEEARAGGDRDAWIDAAVRANVHHSAAALHADSALLRRFVERDGLLIVGAQYRLDTGLVEFFD